MSKVIRQWEEIGLNQTTTKKPVEDIRSFYEKLCGRYYSNGLNIGREVTDKLEGKNFDIIWPTLLQAEGMDSGLTAGYLTACNICVIDGLEEDPMRHLPEVMKKIYGVEIELETIEDEESLSRYPSYVNYPEEQQWSLPAIMIHYRPLDTTNSNSAI